MFYKTPIPTVKSFPRCTSDEQLVLHESATGAHSLYETCPHRPGWKLPTATGLLFTPWCSVRARPVHILRSSDSSRSRLWLHRDAELMIHKAERQVAFTAGLSSKVLSRKVWPSEDRNSYWATKYQDSLRAVTLSHSTENTLQTVFLHPYHRIIQRGFSRDADLIFSLFKPVHKSHFIIKHTTSLEGESWLSGGLCSFLLCAATGSVENLLSSSSPQMNGFWFQRHQNITFEGLYSCCLSKHPDKSPHPGFKRIFSWIDMRHVCNMFSYLQKPFKRNFCWNFFSNSARVSLSFFLTFFNRIEVQWVTKLANLTCKYTTLMQPMSESVSHSGEMCFQGHSGGSADSWVSCITPRCVPLLFCKIKGVQLVYSLCGQVKSIMSKLINAIWLLNANNECNKPNDFS